MLKTKLIKSLLSASVLVAFAAPLAVHAQAQAPAAGMNTPATSTLNKTDQKIVKEMARVNMAEIEAGKMALEKSQSADVRAYAQRMVDDHTRALANVTTLAQNKGVTLPNELDAKHKKMAARLSKLEGDAFDREYMQKAGVADHTQAHAMLKRNAERAKDPDVAALAAKMAPTVAEHLSAAKASPMTNAATMKPTPEAGANDTARGASGTAGATGANPAPEREEDKQAPAPAKQY